MKDNESSSSSSSSSNDSSSSSSSDDSDAEIEEGMEEKVASLISTLNNIHSSPSKASLLTIDGKLLSKLKKDVQGLVVDRLCNTSMKCLADIKSILEYQHKNKDDSLETYDVILEEDLKMHHSGKGGNAKLTLPQQYAQMGLWLKITSYTQNMLVSIDKDLSLLDEGHCHTINVNEHNIIDSKRIDTARKADDSNISFVDLYREMVTSSFEEELSTLRETGFDGTENELNLLIDAIESGTLLFDEKQKGLLLKGTTD